MAREIDLLLRLGENGSKILDTATKGAVAYMGYKSTDHWTGAVTALIALKLASGGNLAGGVAGVAVLTTIGLASGADARMAMTEETYIERKKKREGKTLYPIGWQIMVTKP